MSFLSGGWSEGTVRGALQRVGWGVAEGYPALRWEPEGAGRVAVHLLVSSDLPAHWARLDSFEGDDYLRILVPVERDGALAAVANLFAVREP